MDSKTRNIIIGGIIFVFGIFLILSAPIWTIRYFEMMIVMITIGLFTAAIGVLFMVHGFLQFIDKKNENYAEISKRFAATIIDYLIISVVGIILTAALMFTGVVGLTDNPYEYNENTGKYTKYNTIDSDLPFWIMLVFSPAYFILLEGPAGRGITIGKRIMKIKVVSTDNLGAPSFKQSVIRTLTRCFDLMFSFHVVGLLISFVSEKNQRLGDKLAGTIVVRK